MTIHLYDEENKRPKCGVMGGVYGRPKVTMDKDIVTCKRCLFGPGRGLKRVRKVVGA